MFLTRLLDAQAERCPPFRVFFALTFSDAFAADHPNITVTALGGASAGRRFFAGRADNRHSGQYFRCQRPGIQWPPVDRCGAAAGQGPDISALSAGESILYVPPTAPRRGVR